MITLYPCRGPIPCLRQANHAVSKIIQGGIEEHRGHDSPCDHTEWAQCTEHINALVL